MSVEQVDVIDFIGVESSSGKLVLTISDHLDWDQEGEHLLTLQEKLNTYIAFMESGQILKAYPNAAGRSVTIDVAMRTPPPPSGMTSSFFEKVRTLLEGMDLELRTMVIAGP